MRSQRGGGYAWAMVAALKVAGGQGSASLAVYVALCMAESMTLPADKEWFPASLEQLAELSGLCRRAVHGIIPKLIEAGLVEVQARNNSRGRSLRNLYHLTDVSET